MLMTKNSPLLSSICTKSSPENVVCSFSRILCAVVSAVQNERLARRRGCTCTCAPHCDDISEELPIHRRVSVWWCTWCRPIKNRLWSAREVIEKLMFTNDAERTWVLQLLSTNQPRSALGNGVAARAPHTHTGRLVYPFMCCLVWVLQVLQATFNVSKTP